ncbi:hypothetical protein TNCV_3312391 [Trichonephila clavipes]|nr:hypothetical protein TNCV_3312391 [Trichonephila clavipes]
MSRSMLCYIAICDPSLAIVQQCNFGLYKICKQPDTVKFFKLQILKWVNHLVIMNEDRCCKLIFLAKPIGSRPRSGPTLGWNDCFEKDLNILKGRYNPYHHAEDPPCTGADARKICRAETSSRCCSVEYFQLPIPILRNTSTLESKPGFNLQIHMMRGLCREASSKGTGLAIQTTSPGLGYSVDVMSRDGLELGSEQIKSFRRIQIHRLTHVLCSQH